MTSVADAISTLLYTHDAVIVPGLGAFLCHAEGAKVNVITNQFSKPSAMLGFDPQQREENDLIVNYLVANDGITVEEARQLVAEFVSDVFARLKAGEKVDISVVGSLWYGDKQEIVFDALASNDFNGDAFGLEDIYPQPVFGVGYTTWNIGYETQDEDQEERDLMQETIEGYRYRWRWWIWVLLVLLAATGGVWWYIKTKPTSPKPWSPEQGTLVQPTPQELPFDSIESSDTVQQVSPDTTLDFFSDTTLVVSSDTMSEISPDTTLNVVPEAVPEVSSISKSHPVEVIAPEVSSKAFIVGGCFSVEQNALNMVIEVREQGCTDAFVMKRGSKFFVCYGQYPSTADANAALPQVLSNYNDKAWILTK